jgi:hypothetical protein
MRRSASGILAFTLLAAAVPPASAQQSVPVSVERIRAALQRPSSRLAVEYRQPDFSIHIRERRPMEDLFETPLWDTPPVTRQAPSTLARIEGTPGSTPPLFQTGLDPAALTRSASKRLKDHTARTQTERAIAGYCAAQPDAGSSIPLCWAYPSP